MPMIDLALSPRFLFAMNGISDIGKPHFALSQESITQLFSQAYVIKDLDRTEFVYDGTPFFTYSKMNDNEKYFDRKRVPVALTESMVSDDDLKALTAAALTAGILEEATLQDPETNVTKKIAQLQHMQAGIFLIPFKATLSWGQYFNVPLLLAQGQKHLTLNPEGFNITSSNRAHNNFLLSEDFLHSVAPNDQEYLNIFKNNKNPIQHEYNYKITKSPDNSYNVAVDFEHYKFNMEEKLYQKIIRPKILEKLAATEKLSLNDLTMIIPCLTDKSLQRLFAKKLAHDNDPIVINKANHLIGLAFEKRYKDMERIANHLEKYKVHAFLQPLSSLNQASDFYEKHLKEEIENILLSMQKILAHHHQPSDQLDDAITKLSNPKFIGSLSNTAHTLNDEKFKAKFLSLIQNMQKLAEFKQLRQDSLENLNFSTNEAKVAEFSKLFAEKEPVFRKGASKTELHLLKAFHLILSVTVIYAIGAAIYSKKNRGSPQYWKTSEELVKDKSEKVEKLLKRHSSNSSGLGSHGA